MKGLRIILIKSFLFLAVLFCAGSNSFADYFQLHTGSEITLSGYYNEEIVNSSDSDSGNDDQIDSSYDNDLKEESVWKESIPEKLILICDFPISVWQPPKNS